MKISKLVEQFYILIILETLLQISDGNWWLISKLSPNSLSMGPMLCNTIPGLVWNQKRMCQHYPESLIALRNGLKLGLQECQIQFRKNRWNCTHFDKNLYLFGQFLSKGTKETAFLYSVSSAGAAYSLVRSCSRGEISGCACDPNKIEGKPPAIDYTGRLFNWAGCSDNVDFGCKFSRVFIDGRDRQQRDARALMNVHNNKVGRKAVKKAVKLECKCHGVSGSCNIRTCWRTMKNFKVIGKYLKAKYDRSNAIMINQDGTELIVKRDTIRRWVRPRYSDLVYLEESPNYCHKNIHTGSLGTAGRLCAKNSAGPEGCLLLCCGRGYDTRIVLKIFKCHCKFEWCCKLRCQTCHKWVEEHSCKHEHFLDTAVNNYLDDDVGNELTPSLYSSIWNRFKESINKVSP